MYLDYYQLDAEPFAATPEPRLFYASKTHWHALVNFVIGIESGIRFQVLLADSGLGKTSVLRAVLDHPLDHTKIVFVTPDRCDRDQLLQILLKAFALPHLFEDKRSSQEVLENFVRAQHSSGNRVVAVIDEGDNLANDILRSIRDLGGNPGSDGSSLQFVLAGRSESGAKLRGSELGELWDDEWTQTLRPLISQEIWGYITHRLRLCGSARDLFTPDAVRVIARGSGGVPREINRLCSLALSAGEQSKQAVIDDGLVQRILMKSLSVAVVTGKPEVAVEIADTSPAEAAEVAASGTVDVIAPEFESHSALPESAVENATPDVLASARCATGKGWVFGWPMATVAALILLTLGAVAVARKPEIRGTSWIKASWSEMHHRFPFVRVRAEAKPPVFPAETLPSVTLAAMSPASEQIAEPQVAATNTDSIAELVEHAKAGEATAQYKLAKAYAEGDGLPRDGISAYAWYVLAGSAGVNAAQQSIQRLTPQLSRSDIARVRAQLGRMYSDGIGARKDYVEAYYWFALAGAAGGKDGQEEKRHLASRMSAAEIREAESRASDWLRKHGFQIAGTQGD